MADRERLKVLDAARRYGDRCIDVAQSLPRSAPTGLRTQLIESAQAVSRILAEGFGRLTNSEKIHYSQMANGSLEESQDCLRRCVNRGLIDRKTFYELWHLSVAISRMLEFPGFSGHQG